MCKKQNKDINKIIAELDYNRQYPYGEGWQAEVIGYDSWYFKTKLPNISKGDIAKVQSLINYLGVGVTSIFMKDDNIYIYDNEKNCYDINGEIDLFVTPPISWIWLRIDKIKQRSEKIRNKRFGSTTDEKALQHMIEGRKIQLARIRQNMVM